MRAGHERGEGRMGTIVGLLLFVGVILAIWNLGPVFWADYNFRDKLNEIARVGRHRESATRSTSRTWPTSHFCRQLGGVQTQRKHTPPRAFALPPKSLRAGVNPALRFYGLVASSCEKRGARRPRGRRR